MTHREAYEQLVAPAKAWKDAPAGASTTRIVDKIDEILLAAGLDFEQISRTACEVQIEARDWSDNGRRHTFRF